MPVDPGSGPEAVERLRQARAEVTRSPTNLLAQLHLARSTAALGRLREAVDLLTRAAYFQDQRVFRYRGEYRLRLRQLDLAIADFRLAGQLSMGAQGLPEEVERSDGTRAVSTVFFQTTFLLGVALYCRGDFAGARIALTEAAKRALTPDDLAQTTFWLFLAVRRTGGAEEAKQLLTGVTEDWAVGGGFHEHALLLGFNGMLPSDTVRARAMASRATAERTLYAYGIGYVLLMQDRGEEAALWLDHARLSPDWTTLPYLGAESELARMRKR
jgi:tetratricopeptide (TPR) repeat protein